MMSKRCKASGKTACKDSTAPLVDPGNAMTTLVPTIPTTLLDNAAYDVRSCPYFQIASSIPGIRLSNKGVIASGV